MVASFLFSLSINFLQLMMNYFYVGSRIFDSMDLIANVLGDIIEF